MKEIAEHLGKYCEKHNIGRWGVTYNKEEIRINTRLHTLDDKTKADLIHITKGKDAWIDEDEDRFNRIIITL